MKQQINLYIRQEKVRVPFAAGRCALILLVTAITVAGLWGYQYSRLAAYRTDAAALEAQKRRYDAEIQALTRQLKPPAPSPALDARIAALTEEIAAKERFGGLLAQLQPDRRTPFSALLEGLANRVPDGLWLTRIRADQGGRDLDLEGNVVKPALVPRLIEQLGEEPAYRRARFGRFSLNASGAALGFEVGAVLPAGGQDG